MIENIEDYRMEVRHNGSLPISTGKSRMEKNWKNKTVTWDYLVKKIQSPIRTAESYSEFLKMSKADQDRAKDVGGFVGGSLKSGQRKTDSVECRQIITLDADFAPVGMLEDLELLFDYNCLVYSTHKHCLEKPRYRLLFPLNHPVTPDEYEAVARKLAQEIGIDYFDDTTYQPSRLMYWPSVANDGEYIFKYFDEPWIDPQEVLNRYPDWTDTSYWRESSRAGEIRKRQVKKQGDPCEKGGLIGAFCRTYGIEEAIETFIPETYIKCDMQDRYTYTEGSTAAGLVIYEDDKFAYSNHATDPTSGKLCNAFDLVRIHKFGYQDAEVSPDTTITKLPSFKAMQLLVQQDEKTSYTLAVEKKERAREEFEEFEDDSWMGKIEYGKDGRAVNTLENLLLILKNDPLLKPIVFNQMGDGMEIIGEVPWKHPGKFWRDADDAQLICYVDTAYGSFSKEKYMTAITKVTDDRAYHPVREFLNNLPEWDEVPRVDNLLIDYLGAEDNDYVRAVTRKTLCAAVIRILNPGCKFDTMLVFSGPQGIGKSTLISKLGGEWYSDSLQLTDTKDKTAAEKLQGYWILEIGELAGMRKAEVETLRGFITRQNDIYRASFGRRTTPHLRQCIFVGTTNAEDGYLRDTAGNRRFWPVKTPGGGRKAVWEIAEGEILQIWAEVKVRIAEGEKLVIEEDELQKFAENEQRDALEGSEKEGLVSDFLEKKLPENWDILETYERRDYLYGNDFGGKKEEGTLERSQVSVIEIWCECFGKDKAGIKRMDSNEIAAILLKIGGWERDTKASRISLYGTQKVWKKCN